MSEEARRYRRSHDTLVVPFIFVPHGDPVPHEWLARHSDPIRVPATFVRRQPAPDQPQSQLWSDADFADAPALTGAGGDLSEVGPEAATEQPGTFRAEPIPSVPDPDHAIATYLRINYYLDGIGLGHSRVVSGSSAPTARSMQPSAPSVTQPAADIPPGRPPEISQPTATAPSDPNAPVPLVDDKGNPVLNEDGQPILRPASLDPHFFIERGLEDKRIVDDMIRNGGVGGAAAADAYRAWELSRFLWWQPWDAQRVGKEYHPEFVDYASVIIGLYAAATGMTRDEILTLQDLAAAVGSRFRVSAQPGASTDCPCSVILMA